jgi:hypothetical protein
MYQKDAAISSKAYKNMDLKKIRPALLFMLRDATIVLPFCETLLRFMHFQTHSILLAVFGFFVLIRP